MHTCIVFFKDSVFRYISIFRHALKINKIAHRPLIASLVSQRMNKVTYRRILLNKEVEKKRKKHNLSRTKFALLSASINNFEKPKTQIKTKKSILMKCLKAIDVAKSLCLKTLN